MPENDALVTVVIPPLGQRQEELNRAINSVLIQEGIKTLPLVVVNGQVYDQAVMDALRSRDDIRLHHAEKASVSNARYQGRLLVDTPYFMLLDDDDMFLEGAAREGMVALEQHGADVIALNGFRQYDGQREVFQPSFDAMNKDPALALLQKNWLMSAGGFYRTETIGPDFLAGLPDYLELTVLAFRLALTRKVVGVDFPAFVIHEDHGRRASQSLNYFEESPKALKMMEEMTDRPDLQRLLAHKRSAALHHVADLMLKDGRKGCAWHYHLKSLCVGDGWQFLPFTRHILLA